MTNPDSPAFAAGGENWNQEGLTKREYFAAMAMQGVLANGSAFTAEKVSDLSIRYADAVIKALNYKEEEI